MTDFMTQLVLLSSKN